SAAGKGADAQSWRAGGGPTRRTGQPARATSRSRSSSCAGRGWRTAGRTSRYRTRPRSQWYVANGGSRTLVATSGRTSSADRGPYRVRGTPGAADETVARRADPDREVAVLPVRPAEPLVEAADLGQHGPPVRHVRRRPGRVREPRGVALPVRRGPVGRQRYF